MHKCPAALADYDQPARAARHLNAGLQRRAVASGKQNRRAQPV